MKKFILLFVLLAAAVPVARADGDPSQQGSDHDSQTGTGKADAALADPRLPPVIPGQEVSDGKNTIKVWSTAGTVHGDQQQNPSPQYAPNYGIPGGVIVDNRGGTANGGGNTSGNTGIIRVPAR